MKKSIRKFVFPGIAFFWSISAFSAELSSNSYEIYVGDLDNDGQKDFYFHGKDLFVLLHGDVSIPLLIAGSASYVIYRESNGYSVASLFKLTNTDITSYITQGKLRVATVSNIGLGTSTDVVYWHDELNGYTSVLLRGADTYEPALLLATSANNDLPLVVGVYAYDANRPNLSNRSLVFNLQDVNSDGRRDLATSSQVYLANYAGLLSERAYSVSQTSNSSVVEEFFYDELGRLVQVDSTDGATQTFSMDKEDNRTASGATKGI